MGAGAAEGQRAVLVPLDLVQRIQQPVGGFYLDLVLLPVGLLIRLRIESLDLECNLHGILPLMNKDDRRLTTDGAVLRPSSVVHGPSLQYVLGFGSKRVMDTGLYLSSTPLLGAVGQGVL